MNISKYLTVKHLFGLLFYLFLSIMYSLYRDSDYSTFLKPLPIIFCFLVLLFSERIDSAQWLVMSLAFAILGDILLDLGDQWLQLGALPFLGSTTLMMIAFHTRLNRVSHNIGFIKRASVLLAVSLPFVLLFNWLITYSTEAIKTGGILFTLSAGLIALALNNVLFNGHERYHIAKPIFGLIGAIGIVANYVLYSVNLYVEPIPRDLVIQVYYWGTAFVTWSFLK